MEEVGVSTTEHSQSKSVKPRRVCKLRSGVNWCGVFKQKGIEQWLLVYGLCLILTVP